MTEELSQETVGRETTEVAGGMASAETKAERRRQFVGKNGGLAPS